MVRVSKIKIWYYLTMYSIIAFILMAIRFVYLGQTFTLEQLGFFDKIISLAGLLGFFVFWTLCLMDFFANTDIRNKVAWGFALLLFSWLSCIFYFYKFFWKENRINQADQDQ